MDWTSKILSSNKVSLCLVQTKKNIPQVAIFMVEPFQVANGPLIQIIDFLLNSFLILLRFSATHLHIAVVHNIAFKYWR